jgi:Sir2 family
LVESGFQAIAIASSLSPLSPRFPFQPFNLTNCRRIADRRRTLVAASAATASPYQALGFKRPLVTAFHFNLRSHWTISDCQNKRAMTTSETSDDATAAAASNAGNNESTSDNVTAVDNTKEVTVADVDTAATNVNSNTEVDTTAATTAAADSADALAAALESQLHIGEDKRTNETRESASSGTAASSSTEHDNEVELETPPPPETLVQIAQWIDEAQDILVLTGAGVSVAAGIPDFRTPGTGLYDNLQKYNLPYAEAVFDIDYYPRHPQPFVQLAAELWPNPSDASSPKPTLTHCFVALLAKKGKLLRNYSQVRFFQKPNAQRQNNVSEFALSCRFWMRTHSLKLSLARG